MKIDLVFHDWIDEASSESVRYTEKGAGLSLGDFHGGTTFNAEIELENYQGELEAAARDGIVPVFYALLSEEGPQHGPGKPRTHWHAATLGQFVGQIVDEGAGCVIFRQVSVTPHEDDQISIKWEVIAVARGQVKKSIKQYKCETVHKTLVALLNAGLEA